MNAFLILLAFGAGMYGLILFSRKMSRTELLRLKVELDEAFRLESYDRTIEEDAFLEQYSKHLKEYPEDYRCKSLEPVHSTFNYLRECHRQTFFG